MQKQQAQGFVRDLIATGLGVEIPAEATIVLSDSDEQGDDPAEYITTPTKLEYANDQYRLILGESFNVDELVATLDWV